MAHSGAVGLAGEPGADGPTGTGGSGGGGPVLLGEPWGDTSRLGRPFAKDPSVVTFAGRHLPYFSLPPAEPTVRSDGSSAPTDAGWGVGIAESTDLHSWRTVAELLQLGSFDGDRGADCG